MVTLSSTVSLDPESAANLNELSVRIETPGFDPCEHWDETVVFLNGTPMDRVMIGDQRADEINQRSSWIGNECWTLTTVLPLDGFASKDAAVDAEVSSDLPAPFQIGADLHHVETTFPDDGYDQPASLRTTATVALATDCGETKCNASISHTGFNEIEVTLPPP